MGSSEEGKCSKSEKSSPPTPDNGNAPMYLDWASLQAYYGHRVAIPPYFNSAVPPGHAPHPYVWGPPQPMMPPPYGAPYAAIYAHGGVYAHTGVPIAADSTGMDRSGKSSGNEDRGLISKLKGFDGLAMSVGNNNADSGKGGTDHPHSHSSETDGSSDGSNAAMVGEKSKRGSRETTPTTTTTADKITNSHPTQELNGPSKKVAATLGSSGHVMGMAVTPNMTTTLDLRSPSIANIKPSPNDAPSLCPPMPNEALTQSERELKREKRKQSNRESARRSRLRKQAETEELAKRVQSLTAENLSLKSELHKLAENSEKLKIENLSLMERLKREKLGQMGEVILGRINEKGMEPMTTADLLGRVDCGDKTSDEEGEVQERSGKSRTKLHQLLDSSPRTDAVAAR